jgi:hypothetical protein
MPTDRPSCVASACSRSKNNREALAEVRPAREFLFDLPRVVCACPGGMRALTASISLSELLTDAAARRSSKFLISAIGVGSTTSVMPASASASSAETGLR